MSFLTSVNISSLISSAVIILLVLDRFFLAKKKDNQDTIQTESSAMSLLRNPVEAYKLEVDKLRDELHAQALKTSNLEGVIAEKEKQLSMFERVFQGRNPEMEAFIKTQSLAMITVQESLASITKTINRRHDDSN